MCPWCLAPKVVLFYSHECSNCDRGLRGSIHVGFILLPTDGLQYKKHIVFQSLSSAEKYRDDHLPDHKIFRVGSRRPVESILFMGVRVRVLQAELMPDHRHAPSDEKVFLVPDNIKLEFNAYTGLHEVVL